MIGESPTVARVTTTHPSLCSTLDAMLYDTDNPASCFWEEVRFQTHLAPTFQSLLATAHSVYIVGARGRALGCVAVEPIDALGWQYLRALCVDPLQRGEGIGTMLLRHAQAHHPRLELMVYRACTKKGREHAQGLVRFYTKHGFAITVTEQHYVRMRWSSAQKGVLPRNEAKQRLFHNSH